jgi:hypothetical protein
MYARSFGSSSFTPWFSMKRAASASSAKLSRCQSMTEPPLKIKRKASTS